MHAPGDEGGQDLGGMMHFVKRPQGRNVMRRAVERVIAEVVAQQDQDGEHGQRGPTIGPIMLRWSEPKLDPRQEERRKAGNRQTPEYFDALAKDLVGQVQLPIDPGRPVGHHRAREAKLVKSSDRPGPRQMQHQQQTGGLGQVNPVISGVGSGQRAQSEIDEVPHRLIHPWRKGEQVFVQEQFQCVGDLLHDPYRAQPDRKRQATFCP